MRNHLVRFTAEGVYVQAPLSASRGGGGLEVAKTRGGYHSIGTSGAERTAVREPYRSFPEAISHLAKMMDTCERFLAQHPGRASDGWLSMADAKRFVRTASENPFERDARVEREARDDILAALAAAATSQEAEALEIKLAQAEARVAHSAARVIAER